MEQYFICMHMDADIHFEINVVSYLLFLLWNFSDQNLILQHIFSKNVIPVILHGETVYSPVICNNIDLYCILHVALEVDFINVRDFVMFSAVRVVQILATIKEHEHCSLLKER